jgi:hypothetical protein
VDTIFLARRLAAVALSWGMLLATGAIMAPGAASAAGYVPGEIVVAYAPSPGVSVAKHSATRMGIRAVSTAAPSVEVLRLPRGVTVAQAMARLRHQPGVAYAVPNFIAHAAGSWIPNLTIPAARTAPAGGKRCNGTSCRR